MGRDGGGGRTAVVPVRQSSRQSLRLPGFMKPRDRIRDANQTTRHVDCSQFKVKGDRPPTDCAQHVVNECILASSLIQDRLCDGTVGMHHDRSPRPQRGPPSHRRGYSTDFFIVNMHSGHFGPIRVEDTVVPVSSPEAAAGRAASVS